MVATAASLFQRQGYAATGWRQVVAVSETPWGSQSHHFPGGKEELAADALRRAGASYERLVRQAFADGDPVQAITMWASLAATVLEASDWAEGCPVATVTLEMAHDSDDIGGTCREVFASWRTAIADGLVAAGIGGDRVDRLATFVLASIEGALLLARAERDGAPLLAVGEEMAEVFRLELATAGTP